MRAKMANIKRGLWGGVFPFIQQFSLCFTEYSFSSGFLYPSTLPLCLLICLLSCLLLHRQTRLLSPHFQPLFFVAPQLSVAFYWSSLAAPKLTKQHICVQSDFMIYKQNFNFAWFSFFLQYSCQIGSNSLFYVNTCTGT